MKCIGKIKKMFLVIIVIIISKKYIVWLRIIINVWSGKYFKIENCDKILCIYEVVNIFIDF